MCKRPEGIGHEVIRPVGRKALEDAAGVGDLGLDEGDGKSKGKLWVEAGFVLGKPSRAVWGRALADAEYAVSVSRDNDRNFASQQRGDSGHGEGAMVGDDDALDVAERNVAVWRVGNSMRRRSLVRLARVPGVVRQSVGIEVWEQASCVSPGWRQASCVPLGVRGRHSGRSAGH